VLLAVRLRWLLLTCGWSAACARQVEVLGSSGQRRGLVGGSKKTEETGLGLQDSPR
jgi:hypothetical protein